MKHKAGIIGYGNMGSWHAENINSRIEDLEVVAIYDIEGSFLKRICPTPCRRCFWALRPV